jgi:hypothetical protein
MQVALADLALELPVEEADACVRRHCEPALRCGSAPYASFFSARVW